MNLDTDENALLESVKRDEWKSTRGGKWERSRYARAAKATFRKDRWLDRIAGVGESPAAPIVRHVVVPTRASASDRRALRRIGAADQIADN
jgi:hypothetical protein